MKLSKMYFILHKTKHFGNILHHNIYWVREHYIELFNNIEYLINQLLQHLYIIFGLKYHTILVKILNH